MVSKLVFHLCFVAIGGYVLAHKPWIRNNEWAAPPGLNGRQRASPLRFGAYGAYGGHVCVLLLDMGCASLVYKVRNLVTLFLVLTSAFSSCPRNVCMRMLV